MIRIWSENRLIRDPQYSKFIIFLFKIAICWGISHFQRHPNIIVLVISEPPKW